MSEKRKTGITNHIMAVAPKIFGCIVILCAVFLCVGSLLLPRERDEITTGCKEFESEWYHVLENGEKHPVEVPGEVPAKSGELVTLTTTLPDEIGSGEVLCFRTVWQDVNVYVDGELRVEYTTKDSRLWGTNSAFRYLFVRLEEGDAGAELTYEFTSQSKYAGTMRSVYIGDRAGIWFYILKDSAPKILVALGLMLLSLFCIIVCGIIKFVYKRTLQLNYLAWAIFLCAFWMLSEMEIRQLIVDNVSMISNSSYWSLMLIPIPLVLYMNGIQMGRYKRLYVINVVYATVIFVVGTVLQMLDVMQFVEQLTFIHVGIIFTLVSIIGTMIIDLFQKRMKDYMVVGTGVLGMLLSAVVEIGFYYAQIELSLGTALAMGLMFLLVMAIIKAGQDLLLTETKKQQAISAKEAEERFLANMSHEIRTPMNAIVGMTEILLRGNVTEEQNEYLNNIKNSGNALVSIINDILDISKIEAGKMELVDDVYAFRPMLDDIKKIIKNRIGDKPIKLLSEVDQSVPAMLYGDGLRIRQIIINLANNAVKFTERGQIRITIKAEPTEDGRIGVFVSVADTGQGIKPEDIKKLFCAFQQVDSVKNKGKEGTGLGLSISRRFVEMMGGQIEVKSEYGKGSEFFFTICQQPVSEEMMCKLEAEENMMNFRAPKAKILLVDDDELNRKVALGLLEPLQMQIDTAVNGKNALSMIRKKAYDLVFMDHMMPVMNGVEATGILREMKGEYYQKLPVIALTADAMKESQQLFAKAGMNGFVPKPIQMKQICRVIREWLRPELIEPVEDDRNAPKIEAVSKEPVAEETLQSGETLQIEGIDVFEGIKNTGSKEFLYERLGDYCNLIDSKSRTIEQYLEAGRIRDFTIEVHALKSSSRMIGAMRLSEQFRLLEDLGNANDIESITKSTPEVLEHYNKYKEWLAPFAAMKEREKKDVPREEVLMYLQGMKESIEAFDLDTADAAMEKLEECRLPEKCIPMMKELRPLFADVAMEEIIALTEEMMAVVEENKSRENGII